MSLVFYLARDWRFFATYHFWVSLMVGCLVYVVERNLCVVDLQSNTKYVFFNLLFANPQRQGSSLYAYLHMDYILCTMQVNFRLFFE